MSLFKNKFRIESARWQEWDYRNEGAYFITICTGQRICYFGECNNGKMDLTEAGGIAEENWTAIPDHFQHVSLGEYQVMPNHVHGIIIINDPPVETLQCNVSTGGNEFMSEISPKSGSVSAIIRSYKSACSKTIRQQYPKLNFQWQSRFHDRVIRNKKEYDRIENYIVQNPENWHRDKYFNV
jgi:REP element-mobilizing transposase RayT